MERGNPKTVGCIIPALNEADHIAKVVAQVPRAALEGRGYRVRILVVDGHSVDGTLDVAAQAGAEVLSQSGRGKGQALREAFERLRCDYVFLLDGDGTYSPGAILDLLDPLIHDLDVVMGERIREDAEAADWLTRFGNRVLTDSANLLLGTEIRDLCTGMWGFRGTVAAGLAVSANGFDVEADMLAKCARAGYRIGQVPVRYRCRARGSKLHPLRDGTRILARLVREALPR